MLFSLPFWQKVAQLPVKAVPLPALVPPHLHFRSSMTCPESSLVPRFLLSFLHTYPPVAPNPDHLHPIKATSPALVLAQSTCFSTKLSLDYLAIGTTDASSTTLPSSDVDLASLSESPLLLDV